MRVLRHAESDNARVNRATGKGLNLRVERMVKWRSHHPRNEPTPPRDVASVQRIVIPRPTTSLSHILASLPNEVEFAQAWPEFGRACPVMFEFGRHGQAIRWLFRTVYRCLLPRLRHGRSRSEHVAIAFEGIVSMSDYAVAMDSRRDNGSDHRARTIIVASKHARKPGFACITCYSAFWSLFS